MAMLDTLGCLSNSQRIYHRPYSVLSSDPNLGCQTHIGTPLTLYLRYHNCLRGGISCLCVFEYITTFPFLHEHPSLLTW